MPVWWPAFPLIPPPPNQSMHIQSPIESIILIPALHCSLSHGLHVIVAFSFSQIVEPAACQHLDVFFGSIHGSYPSSLPLSAGGDESGWVLSEFRHDIQKSGGCTAAVQFMLIYPRKLFHRCTAPYQLHNELLLYFRTFKWVCVCVSACWPVCTLAACRPPTHKVNICSPAICRSPAQSLHCHGTATAASDANCQQQAWDMWNFSSYSDSSSASNSDAEINRIFGSVANMSPPKAIEANGGGAAVVDSRPSQAAISERLLEKLTDKVAELFEQMSAKNTVNWTHLRVT